MKKIKNQIFESQFMFIAILSEKHKFQIEQIENLPQLQSIEDLQESSNMAEGNNNTNHWNKNSNE